MASCCQTLTSNSKFKVNGTYLLNLSVSKKRDDIHFRGGEATGTVDKADKPTDPSRFCGSICEFWLFLSHYFKHRKKIFYLLEAAVCKLCRCSSTRLHSTHKILRTSETEHHCTTGIILQGSHLTKNRITSMGKPTQEKSVSTDTGIDIDYERAREIIYGMPFPEWKRKYQKQATEAQLALFSDRAK